MISQSSQSSTTFESKVSEDQSSHQASTPERTTRISVPAEPLVIVQPTSEWSSLNLTELWNYRELIYFLTWRDVKVRYKQTALGVGWAIMQPLFTMLIFTLFFGRLAGVPSDNIPYPIFAYAGLLAWTFFSNAVTSSGNSLIGSAHLITKVYFPRMSIPAAAVLAGIVDLAFGLVILILLMLYYRVVPTWSVLLFPFLVLLTALLALGVGLWLSALNVKYRDVRFALPFVIQLWMFVSPIIYPSSFLPSRFRWILALNPLTGIIEGYRSSLFGVAFNWRALAISIVITFAMLVYSSFMFRRMEKSFADIV